MEFQVHCDFDRAFPEEKKFNAREHPPLLCSPIVNLFRMDAEPIRLDHLQPEYRVVPDIQHPKGHQVYSVDSIIGTEEGTGKRHIFPALLRRGERKPGGGPALFQALNPRRASGTSETFISLGG